jgi:hypothetical protein
MEIMVKWLLVVTCIALVSELRGLLWGGGG